MSAATAQRLADLARRLCAAPDLTSQGADLMVRLDHAAISGKDLGTGC